MSLLASGVESGVRSGYIIDPQGSLAQLVEQLTLNQRVVGSSSDVCSSDLQGPSVLNLGPLTSSGLFGFWKALGADRGADWP